jgi:hypothetical protein
MAARADSAAYAAGAKRLRNFIPMMTGGVRKRPGTTLHKASASESRTRLIEWDTGLRGENARLLLVLSVLPGTSIRIDIYRETELAGQLTLSGVGEAGLFEIQYAVTGETGASTLWLAHRSIAPRSMRVTEDAVPSALDTPAFFEAVAGTWGEELLSGYAAYEEIGITSENPDVYKVNVTLSKDVPKPVSALKIKIQLFHKAGGQGLLVGTKEEMLYESSNLFVKGAVFPVEVPLNGQAAEYPVSFLLGYIYRMYTPAETIPLFEGPGKYPGAVSVYAGRLCLGGTDEYPSRIWLSRPPDSLTGQNRFLDFTSGENAGDAIVIEENDMAGSRLLWLAAGRRLIAGTARAVWSDNGSVPTPAAFDMGIVEYAGAAALRPKGTKEIMAYAGRNGKTLRAVVWQETSEGAGFIDADLSQNAPHLFTSGIADFDVMDYPYPVIWIVTGDGALASCTIDLRSGVLAFARHDTAGKFKACAVRRADGRDDTLFLAVERPESAKMDIVALTLPEIVDADYEESHYLDCGIRVECDPPVAGITLPEPLRRDGVQAFADGSPEPISLSADKSRMLFQNPIRLAHIGMPYKSELSPNTPEIPANGTSTGKKRRVEKATLKLYGSMGGRCGVSEEKAVPIPYMRYGKYRLGEAPQPFTGDIDITSGGKISSEGNLVITHGEPMPFTLLALVERVAILEA